MNKKEKFIKDSLQNYKGDLNVLELWAGVEEGLEKKKKRGLWFFFISGMLLSFLFLGYHIFMHEGKSEVKQKYSSEFEDIHLNQTNKSGHPVTKPQDEVIALNNKTIKNIINSSNAGSVKKKKNKNAFKKSANYVRTEVNENLNQIRVTNNHSFILFQEGIFSNSKMEEDKINIEHANQSNNKKIDVELGHRRDLIDQISSIQILDCHLLNYTIVPPSKPFPNSPINTNKNWILGIYGGTSFSSLQYISSSSELVNELVNQRNSSEKYSPSLFFSIRGSRLLNIRKFEYSRHQLSLETGLSYFSNKFIFEGKELIETIDTIQGVTEVIQNIDGSLTNVIGEVVKTTSSYRNVRHINKISLIQTPILLNYQYRINPNMSLSLNSGIGLNFIQTYNGKNHAIENAKFGIASINPTNVSSNFFLSFLGEIGLSHKLNASIHLKGSLFYSSSLQANNIEEMLEAKVISFGGHLGLNYSF